MAERITYRQIERRKLQEMIFRTMHTRSEWVAHHVVHERACFKTCEMAESLEEYRCWVCSLSFDVERKYLWHLTTMKHVEM